MPWPCHGRLQAASSHKGNKLRVQSRPPKARTGLDVEVSLLGGCANILQESGGKRGANAW